MRRYADTPMSLADACLVRLAEMHQGCRVLTLDRGAEITVFSLSGFAGGYAMNVISPEVLTMIAGAIAGSAGIVWFWRERKTRGEIGEILE